MGEITDLFLRDCGKYMDDVSSGIASRDVVALGYVLHTMRGLFRNLSDESAQDLVGRMQAMTLSPVGSGEVMCHASLLRE